ncbi:endonuclease I family protein [Myroides sp. LJL119]
MKKVLYILFSILLLSQISCSKSDDTVIVTPPPVEKPPLPPVDPPTKPNTNNYKPIQADQIAYYKDIDFTLRGKELQNQLHRLLTDTQTTLSYTPDIWEASKITDQDPDNPDNVLVIYGWPNGASKEPKKVRSMPKSETNNQGGNANRNNKWEREHVYAKSLAIPKLETKFTVVPNEQLDIAYIAGNDAHNLRPVNGAMNQDRLNKKFADAKGNSQILNAGYWYPGDEWKGDVARMMMYMYVRYQQQCLPVNVASLPLLVNPETGDRDMVRVLMKWNAEDPVSDIERKRNSYHGDKNNRYAQGNRNPFIDNPHLANLIWGEQTDKELNAESLWEVIQ